MVLFFSPQEMENDLKKNFLEAAEEGYLERCIDIYNSVGEKTIFCDAVDWKGNTALLLAAQYGHVDVCKYLIDKRSQVNAKNSQGFTALHYAARAGLDEMCEALIKDGKADVNVRSGFGDTPLYLCSGNGKVSTCTLLIKNGADVNAAIDSGETPLHAATRADDFETCELLIKSGSNVNVADMCGVTPLHIAVSRSNYELCDLFVKSGANVNAKPNFNDSTPVLIASRERNYKILSLLVDDMDTENLIARSLVDRLEKMISEEHFEKKDAIRRRVIERLGEKRPREE